MKTVTEGAIVVFYSTPRMGERNFKPSQYWEAISFTAERGGSMLVYRSGKWQEEIISK